MKKTKRGFKIFEFTDEYGLECSLQKSSIADKDCVWLGISEPQIHKFTPNKGWEIVVVNAPLDGQVLIESRMHLTRSHVKKLIKHLEKFVETGDL